MLKLNQVLKSAGNASTVLLIKKLLNLKNLIQLQHTIMHKFNAVD